MYTVERWWDKKIKKKDRTRCIHLFYKLTDNVCNLSLDRDRKWSKKKNHPCVFNIPRLMKSKLSTDVQYKSKCTFDFLIFSAKHQQGVGQSGLKMMRLIPSIRLNFSDTVNVICNLWLLYILIKKIPDIIRSYWY